MAGDRRVEALTDWFAAMPVHEVRAAYGEAVQRGDENKRHYGLRKFWSGRAATLLWGLQEHERAVRALEGEPDG